ncbi:hypothetical protein VPH166E361_0116 [Vibrio phage 166E36-1]
MRFLKQMSKDEIDLIKVKVSNSHLDLLYRNLHSKFIPTYNNLLNELGNSYKEELKTFLYNSVSTLKRMDTGMNVSRHNKTYSDFNKNNPKYNPISWRKIKKLFQSLEDLGYIHNYSGFNDRVSGERMSSCVLFTDKFITLFCNEDIQRYGKSTKSTPVVVREEVLVDNDLGEGEVVLVELKYVRGIGEQNTLVTDVNDWLNTHKFKFITYEKPIDLQRIFIERLDKAGRFFFGNLQCISSNKRRLFEIDGESVTELDYVSNHMMIAAELVGKCLPEDFKPYELDVSDLIICEDSGKLRSILKMCCMFLLNSGTPESTFKKFWKSNMKLIDDAIAAGDWSKAESNLFYKVKGLSNTKRIIKRLEEHNNYAKNFFRVKGGSWGYLQFIDSEILLHTMLDMKENDKPFLPYHDSLLCRVKDEEVLRVAMKKSWKKVLGDDINCRIDKKF